MPYMKASFGSVGRAADCVVVVVVAEATALDVDDNVALGENTSGDKTLPGEDWRKYANFGASESANAIDGREEEEAEETEDEEGDDGATSVAEEIVSRAAVAEAAADAKEEEWADIALAAPLFLLLAVLLLQGWIVIALPLDEPKLLKQSGIVFADETEFCRMLAGKAENVVAVFCCLDLSCANTLIVDLISALSLSLFEICSPLLLVN